MILQPWEAYTSDTTIDLTKHHKPKVLLDKIAYWTVKSLRVPTDIFFQVWHGTVVRYMCSSDTDMTRRVDLGLCRGGTGAGR